MVNQLTFDAFVVFFVADDTALIKLGSILENYIFFMF